MYVRPVVAQLKYGSGNVEVGTDGSVSHIKAVVGTSEKVAIVIDELECNGFLRRTVVPCAMVDSFDDETHQKGLKAYGKDRWEGSLQKITRMGGIDIQDMQAVLATDNPHVVMHHLSADPDEYDRVMRLPPARRATEFVKISLKGEPPKKGAKPAPGQQSRATPPVTPVSGNRGMAAKRPNLYDDKMDDDAWYATRNASRRKKFSGVE